ncbi:unknown [Clostridium sp. CAG:149]|nr:unknown [Clostridium sp. CAG:149]
MNVSPGQRPAWEIQSLTPPARSCRTPTPPGAFRHLTDRRESWEDRPRAHPPLSRAWQPPEAAPPTQTPASSHLPAETASTRFCRGPPQRCPTALSCTRLSTPSARDCSGKSCKPGRCNRLSLRLPFRTHRFPRNFQRPDHVSHTSPPKAPPSHPPAAEASRPHPPRGTQGQCPGSQNVPAIYGGRSCQW